MPRARARARVRIIRDNYYVREGVDCLVSETSDEEWIEHVTTKNLTFTKAQENDNPPPGWREFEVENYRIRITDKYVAYGVIWRLF